MSLLDRYIISLCSPVWLVSAVLILLLAAARGIGGWLLNERRDGFSAMALGMAALAAARLLPWNALPYSGVWGPALLLLPAGYGMASVLSDVGRFRRRPIAVSVLALWGVFTLASAFLPPYSWDEQVYQTALWMRFPGLPVVADNPYSAYPLLPQFFLDWGRRWGGLELPRLTVWALTLLLAGKLFMESSRRCGPAGATVLSIVVMFAPVSLTLQRSFYAETFVAVFALAGWLCLEHEEDAKRACFLAGVFAGACAAVKLTGGGAALMLFVCAFNRRRAGWFILGSLLTATPFYLRPMLFCGNPVYPFGALLFGGEETASVERFFRELGSYRYGLSGFPGVALGWLFACFYGRIYDGVVCGFGVMALSVLLTVSVFLRRDKTSGIRYASLFAGYLFWALSSQQTRFLYPLLFPAALVFSELFARWRRRGRAVALAGLALGMALSLPEVLPHLRHHPTAWRVLPSARRAPAEFLARVAGREYVNTLEKIAELVPPGKRVLLLFERRTLFMPAVVEHGTPFFQEKRFTPPPDSGEELLAGLKGFDYVLLGSASGKPDHLESYDEIEAAVRLRLAALVSAGKLRFAYDPVKFHACPLFEVVHER